MEARDWLVTWTDSSNNTFNLNNLISIRATKGKDAKGNTAEIFLDNYAGVNVFDGEFKFESGQTIKIYAKAGIIDRDAPSNDNLVGVWTILDYEVMPDDRRAKITCGDKTYTMLTKLYSRDITDTANNIIFNIVQTSAEGDGIDQNTITTHIASTKSDSSAFTNVTYTSVWKTAYEAISELSQTGYTGDKLPYIFWFDANGEFYWEYPSSTPEATTFSFGDSQIHKMTISKQESATIGFVIYDAGEDKDGQPILGFYVDPNAGSIKTSMKYQPMTDVRDRVRRRYSDVDYAALTNTAFVTECDAIALEQAKNIVTNTGQGLWEATITIDGTLYEPGSLYTMDAESEGFVQNNLRLDTITHKMDKKGWYTDLTFNEDPAEED